MVFSVQGTFPTRSLALVQLQVRGWGGGGGAFVIKGIISKQGPAKLGNAFEQKIQLFTETINYESDLKMKLMGSFPKPSFQKVHLTNQKSSCLC